MSSAAEFVENLHITPEDGSIGTSGASYRDWGFTIYRTAYGPASEQRWQSLLVTIQSQTRECALKHFEVDQDDPDFAHLWSLFRLDARSDKAKFDGLDIDQVRESYNGIDETQPMNKFDSLRRVFLVADEEVLSEANATVVKAASAGYTPVVYDATWDSRGCRQRYFGWMKMTTGRVLDLWRDLENQDFETIAPPTIGESHLVIWDGVYY